MTTPYLQTTTTLTLSAANTIADSAIQAVSNLQTPKPMTVTVLSSSGAILVQKRMDSCPSGAIPKFSHGKAATCIHLNMSSRQFREKYTKENEAAKFTQAASMCSVMGGELVPVAGGVLVRGEDGSVVGSVGVSGAAADEDEYLALMGVEGLRGVSGLGLRTVPEKHCCTTLK